MPATQAEVREQRADLVAGQHPVRLTGGFADPDRAPVGIGVVGDDDVGVHLRRELERQVHGARFLGVGERDGREVRVRVALLAHDVQVGEPGAAHHVDQGVAADTVQRRVDGDDVARTVVGQRGDRLDVGLGDLGAEPRVGVTARHLVDPAGGVDLRGDVGVGRRHDLAGVGEVDLVAVVARRVVRRRDHHAGAAAQVADGERRDRCGQRLGEQVGVHAGALHDLGGVAREDVGVVPRVVADDDAGMWPRARARYAASPDAAWATITRFIRFGPAPSSPRSPAVPNCRRWAKRSSSPAVSSASIRPCSSSRVTGSGSWLSQSRARSRSSMRSDAGKDVGEQGPHAGGRRAARPRGPPRGSGARR